MPEPEDPPSPRTSRPPGQIITVVLLVIGALILIWVCIQVAQAFG